MISYIKNILIAVFLISSLHLFSQHNTFDQKTTIDPGEYPLKTILDTLTDQCSASFSYNSEKVDDRETVNIPAGLKTLGQVLDTISKQKQLDYRLIKGQIILKPSKKEKPEETFTISGIVRDRLTGESLPGATVYVQDIAAGTIANNYGFYSLTLPKGNYGLTFSFVGFSSIDTLFKLTKNMSFNVPMEFNSEQLGEVTITTNEKIEIIEKSQMSRIKVNPSAISRLPEFAGEVGLIKSMQTLPGIKTHSDGSAFFFVRGGNKDQNLILIDEAPVYNPAHLFGYYSVIIPDVAKSIDIYKGDMPINKGDRLSSVIEVQTKDGDLNHFGMTGVLNPLISRIAVEGPIVKDKSSLFTSFRRSNFGWIYRRAAPASDLYIRDVNAKINWKINPNNRLYYSFFYGEDNFTNTENGGFGGIKWHNFTSTLRWNHIFSSQLFSNATFYLSNYNYNLLVGQDKWESEIGNVSLNYDFSYFRNPDNTLRFGLNSNFHSFNPGNLLNPEENPYIPEISRSEAGKTVFYFSTENNLSERFSVKAGVRIPIWNVSGPTTLYQFDSLYQVTDTLFFGERESVSSFINLDPRISLKYKLSKTASLKLSFGIYHQYLHLISNSISPFTSFEVWIPANDNLPPQRAEHLAFGINQVFPEASLEFVAEAYYKHLSKQIDYEPHANLLLNPLMEGEIRTGTGEAYGTEFSLRKTKGRLTGWISYTWSRIFKKIDGLNNNKRFPAYYDRPHDLSVFFSYHLSKKLNFSANWTWYTGSAITTPIGYYQYNGYRVPLYGEKNNDRLPDYHRLDVALSWLLSKPDSKFSHRLNFAIYNFYNRHNAVSINFNKVETKEGNFVVPANLFGTHEIMTTQKYLLGIMPSITYKFEF